MDSLTSEQVGEFLSWLDNYQKQMHPDYRATAFADVVRKKVRAMIEERKEARKQLDSNNTFNLGKPTRIKDSDYDQI